MAENPPPPDRATLLAKSDRELRTIAKLAVLGPYPLRPRHAAQLHSIYLDTHDLTLARYGLSLQLRRQGKRWEATVAHLDNRSTVPQPPSEVTVSLPGPPQVPFTLPEGALWTRLCALVARRPLKPVLVLNVRRRHIDILPNGATEVGQPVAELMLDRVHVRAPDDPHPRALYLEATIACRDRDQCDVAACSRVLQESFGLIPQADSSVARGLALVRGNVALTTGEAQVLAQDTVEVAVHKIVGRHLGRLRQRDPGTRIGEDPEALHDLRVAVRRLRAAARMFAPAFHPRMQRRLEAELKWLGQLSSGVRDLDVQLARLAQHSTGFPQGHRAGLVGLREYMEAERTRLRTELLTGLDSRRYFSLLISLEDFAFGRSAARLSKPAQEPIAHAGARGIKQALRRLRKCGDKVEGTPTPEDLHALRIRAKRLRYLLEFMQELTGKPGRRLVKQLVQLQDLLGTYHDAIVTVDFVRHYAEGPGTQSGAASLLTLGALVNDALRLAEQNRQRFQRTWRRFTRKRTQRQFRTMLRELRGQDTTPDQQDDAASPHASSDATTPAPADSPKTAPSEGQPPVAEDDSRPSEPEKS